MGQQSTTTPIEGSGRRIHAICRRVGRFSTAVWVAAAFACWCGAQTQSAVTPLILPSAITFDAQGNLYIAETGNHVVRKFFAAGVVTVVAGDGVQGFSGDNGPAKDAELDSPAGLAVDAMGNVYIADSHNHRVRKVDAGGTITTIAGTGVAGSLGDGGLATAAQLDLPTALALDSAGNLYIADTKGHRVRWIDAVTGKIATVAGNGVEVFAGDHGAATDASIDSPNGLALDAAGNLYIADTHNGRVREVDAAGVIVTVAGIGGAGGNLQTFGGDGGTGTSAELALPRGLTVDAAGNIYVADSANQRIRRISPTGVITTVAGQGTEAFAGDGGPAVVANLDSPRSVAMSPAGALTLADTENQRIRQLDGLPAPGPDIHTIMGGGTISAGTLTVNGPATVVYGSGSLVVSLSGGTSATGNVTFVDTTGGASVPVGMVNLSAGAATFSTGGLAAGTHSIVAAYAGDATHAAAQSAAFALTVTPLGLTVAANAVSILYGQPVPALSGTLNGVLPQDAGKVTAAFSCSAGLLSAVGTYPIAVVLTGSAAGNYTVTLTPASVTITQAPTAVTLSASTSSPVVGAPVTVTMQVVSSTSGVPTGSVTLRDGTVVLSVAPLADGSASLTTSSLTLGSHTLTAAYSGDVDFLPSTSASANLVVSVAPDFSLTAEGSVAQSVPAGSAATFDFSVGNTGAGLASPILLSVQGVPLGATASLSPSNIPPGGAVTSFTLTIQTPAASAGVRDGPIVPGSRVLVGPVFAVLLLPVMGWMGRFRLRGWGRWGTVTVVALAMLLPLALAMGCGDRVAAVPQDVNAKTYTLTVTGTATSPAGTALQHSVSVTLNVI